VSGKRGRREYEEEERMRGRRERGRRETERRKTR